MAGKVLRCVVRGGVVPLALALLYVAPCPAYDVVQIEEHWALTVGGPEVANSAPQVSMVMSATGDTDSDFFLVNLNHWSLPAFSPGGVQVQRWYGDACEEVAGVSTGQPLDTEGETLRWAQRMTLDGCNVVFELVGGQSTSWGAFTDQGDLRVVASTELARLNDYKPAVSLSQSGIGYAGNWVSALVLERLAWRTSEGEEYEMVAPIDLDSDLDP